MTNDTEQHPAEHDAARTCAGCGALLRLTGGDRGLWTCGTDRCPGNLERLTRVYPPEASDR